MLNLWLKTVENSLFTHSVQVYMTLAVENLSSNWRWRL